MSIPKMVPDYWVFVKYEVSELSGYKQRALRLRGVNDIERDFVGYEPLIESENIVLLKRDSKRNPYEKIIHGRKVPYNRSRLILKMEPSVERKELESVLKKLVMELDGFPDSLTFQVVENL